MNNELLATLDYIEQERGISKEQLMCAIEQAILKASEKNKTDTPVHGLTVKMDRKTGVIKAWAKLEVVESFPDKSQITLEEAKKRIPDVQLGAIVDWEVTPQNFGRVAAQATRQAIFEELRRAERVIVQNEFKDQVGEIVNGNVRRVDAGNIIVDFQKAEGIIESKERVPGEQYMPGERINALLLGFETKPSGPSLLLSRRDTRFIRKLFEREVAEIHDGVVEIVNIAREAGVRTKIAVRSSDPRVDPVGACVGLRGLRVRNITGELGNERVDIIRYDDNLHTYLANAMQPAKILRIEEDRTNKQFTIYVDEENNRLAYGKKAQNVRLAQKLLDWTIEIRLEEPEKDDDFEEKKAKAVDNLAEALAVSREEALLLVDNGYLTLDGLRNAGASELAAIEGIEQKTLDAVARALSQGTTEA